ncbi:Mitochondrial import inner membrane translocase subunit TIM23-1 [Forsythia ovata]|uniref:Mitochondrial import inner membrane translocase subunit TIM23-1 n=1 Tax=Forsythia ovata TaxID=205694 RepID=A0ABD1WDA7_9LAMI
MIYAAPPFKFNCEPHHPSPPTASPTPIENRCGVIDLFYVGLNSGMVAARDIDDVFNSFVARLGTRKIYKATAEPRSAAVTEAIEGMLFRLVVAEKHALKRYVPI